MTAAGLLISPGVGLIAAGPLLATLTAAGAGAVTGTVVGLLKSTGVDVQEAQAAVGALKDGKFVIGAHVSDARAGKASEILHARS